jgi:hypothetical protein
MESRGGGEAQGVADPQKNLNFFEPGVAEDLAILDFVTVVTVITAPERADLLAVLLLDLRTLVFPASGGSRALRKSARAVPSGFRVKPTNFL